jgi:hypothetical protein
MDGNDPADLSHRVSGTLSGPDKSRWTTGTALLGSAATANPSAEMPPQNSRGLAAVKGRDLRVDGQRDPCTGRAGHRCPQVKREADC